MILVNISTWGHKWAFFVERKMPNFWKKASFVAKMSFWYILREKIFYNKELLAIANLKNAQLRISPSIFGNNVIKLATNFHLDAQPKQVRSRPSRYSRSSSSGSRSKSRTPNSSSSSSPYSARSPIPSYSRRSKKVARYDRSPVRRAYDQRRKHSGSRRDENKSKVGHTMY